MRKISLVISVIMFLQCSLYGQPIPNQFVNVGLPTPDVASLGKFGDIPVSYETGVPGITIPIDDIKIGKIDVPVSLDYHAGGIRVNDISSSVGLGWALNCGGVIERTLVGIADELPQGYLSSPASSDTYPSNMSSSDIDFAFSAAGWYGPKTETQPDIFNYSIPGQSGRFIFNHDGSVFQIPLTNNKIQFFPNADSKKSYFIIINDEGVQFTFNDQEVDYLTPIPGYNGAFTSQYVGAWRLSEIKDLNTSETVSFIYATIRGDNNNDAPQFTRNDEWWDMYTAGFETVSLGGGSNAYYATSNHTRAAAPTPQFVITTHYYEKFLQEIDWRGGKMSFVNQSDRLDQPSDIRLGEIDEYDNDGDQVKKVSLDNNHYFLYNSQTATVVNGIQVDNNYSHSNNYNYRMRLDKVNFLSTDNSIPPKVYTLNYFNDPNHPMASRYSCGQDKWGFNNGAFNNSTLMPPQTISTSSGVASFGSADRNTNSDYIKAYTIQSVTYPTGGKDDFEFEPHQYYDPNDQNNITQGHSGCGVDLASNANQLNATTLFTLPTGSHNFRYAFTITENNQPLYNQPVIGVVDVTNNNQQILSLYENTSGNNVNIGNQPIHYVVLPNLIPGHTYKISCSLNTVANSVNNVITNNSGDVDATMDIFWDNFNNAPVSGGGLRVKSITSYDINGAFISKKSYQYNIGQLMTPTSYFNGGTTLTQHGTYDPLGDFIVTPETSITCSSGWVLPTTMSGGSPVLYSDITEFQTSSDGNNGNGKKEYQYQIFQDYYYPTSTGMFFTADAPKLISNFWRNGQLSAEYTYKSTTSLTQPYSLINSKIYSYTIDRTVNKTVMDIAPYIIIDGQYPYIPTNTNGYGLLTFNSYQLPSGVVSLNNIINTSYDDNDNTLITKENYYYSNPSYINLSQKTSKNSKGETITENYKYPYDLAVSGNQYQKIVSENNISPIIQYQKLNNSTQLVQRTANYTDFNDLTNTNPTDIPFLQPTSIDEKVSGNPLYTRIKFNSYDNYGNITQQQKTDDMFQSYIWDYNSMYPVAKVEGASADQIAYTSFESDETNSNWNFFPPAVISSYFTGEHGYYMGGGTYNISTKNNLLPNNQYIVSYWAQTPSPFTMAPCSVSGTIGNPKQGITINGWTYYEHTVTGVSTISIAPLSGYLFLDELRLYPKGAQMETYTYDPLIGIATQCDAANHVTSYEYDGFNRLSLIRDQNGNILKTYCYDYAGQPTNCNGTANIYSTNQSVNRTTFNVVLTNTVSGAIYSFNVPILGYLQTPVGTVPLGNYTVKLTSTENLNHQITINNYNYEGPANELSISLPIVNGLYITISN